MPEIISRKDATARGLKRYFTGRSCKLGHLAERWTVDARCIECTQAAYQTTQPIREIITRQQARDRGLGKYISRRPCKRGHIAQRRTETGYCIECERLVQQTPGRKEYMRRYMRTLRVARKAL
jgi:hypothetical protein